MRPRFARSFLGLCALLWLLAQSSAAAAQAAPSPEQVALSELRMLQQQTPELWRRRDAQCVGCGAAVVIVGVPVASVFLPIGGMILASSGYDDYRDGDTFDPGYSQADVDHDRRLGGALLAIGGLGLAAIAWGAWKIATARRAGRAAERELRGIGERRSALEQMMERFAFGPRRPLASVSEP